MPFYISAYKLLKELSAVFSRPYLVDDQAYGTSCRLFVVCLSVVASNGVYCG